MTVNTGNDTVMRGNCGFGSSASYSGDGKPVTLGTINNQFGPAIDTN